MAPLGWCTKSFMSNLTFFSNAGIAHSKTLGAGTICLRLSSFPIIALTRFVPFLAFSPLPLKFYGEL